ncbi:MAG: hypothetical protein PVI75_01965 [Gammaproteobacteria bacterium]|jgi:hypothetical protein
MLFHLKQKKEIKKYEKIKEEYMLIWDEILHTCKKHKMIFGVSKTITFIPSYNTVTTHPPVIYTCKVFELDRLMPFLSINNEMIDNNFSECIKEYKDGTKVVKKVGNISTTVEITTHQCDYSLLYYNKLPYNVRFYSINPSRLLYSAKQLHKLIKDNNICHRSNVTFLTKLNKYDRKLKNIINELSFLKTTQNFKKEMFKYVVSVALLLNGSLPTDLFLYIATFIPEFYGNHQEVIHYNKKTKNNFNPNNKYCFDNFYMGKKLYSSIEKTYEIRNVFNEMKEQNFTSFSLRIKNNGNFTRNWYTKLFLSKRFYKNFGRVQSLIFASIAFKIRKKDILSAERFLTLLLNSNNDTYKILNYKKYWILSELFQKDYIGLLASLHKKLLRDIELHSCKTSKIKPL